MADDPPITFPDNPDGTPNLNNLLSRVEQSELVLRLLKSRRIDYADDLALIPHLTVLIDRHGDAWKRYSTSYAGTPQGWSCTDPAKNLPVNGQRPSPAHFLPCRIIREAFSPLLTQAPPRPAPPEPPTPKNAFDIYGDYFISLHEAGPDAYRIGAVIQVFYFFIRPRPAHSANAPDRAPNDYERPSLQSRLFRAENENQAQAFAKLVGGDLKDLATGRKWKTENKR